MSTVSLWNADTYDVHSKLQQTSAERFLKLLKNRFDLKKNGSLLDIGSGTGRTSQLIFNDFPEIYLTGVDASKEMVDFANRHFRNSRMSFFQDRAEELKTIAEESFDAAVSFFCLHWVKDQKAAFESIFRVLKPGGWVGLIFAAETGWDDPIDKAYDRALSEEPWKGFFKKNAPQDVGWYCQEVKAVREQLEQCGFEVVFQGAQNADYFFENRKAFEAWIHATSQQLKLLPLDLQSTCASRIAEIYLELTSDCQKSGSECLYHIEGCMWMAVKP